MIALYVEDDDPTFFLVQTALAEAELTVRLFRAANGTDALSFLRNAWPYEAAPQPDLVLLDLNLPRMSGFEVLSVARTEDMLKQIPFLVVTTSSAQADRERSLKLGASAFFTKPATFEALIDLMKSIFNKDWRDCAPVA